MNLAYFLLFCFASVGLTHILVDSKIIKEIIFFGKSARGWLEYVLPTKLHGVLDCYQCMGFWAGLFCGILLELFLGFNWTSLLLVFLCGLTSSLLSNFSVLLFNWFEANTMVLIKEENDNEE